MKQEDVWKNRKVRWEFDKCIDDYARSHSVRGFESHLQQGEPVKIEVGETGSDVINRGAIYGNPGTLDISTPIFCHVGF